MAVTTPNPSLERRPSEAGRFGPGPVKLRYIVGPWAKAPSLSGPPQLERWAALTCPQSPYQSFRGSPG
jgi:hypothetical protein